ncbi:MAG: DNA polymerase III subunit beta [Candidatus Sungbacteria bacterium]|uniref:Beta sliding clamp n=1 Tax=Candidatus Sungiibacteriota bacterium TaxID=2750080 RepID=A0A933DRG9_9BACT|nr:DNA polymerase III subunit beta [Candidatus Sungbacteria bacterium]
MKITCTTENLRSVVAVVERFTGRHITLPILSYILCRADDKKIIFTATNLEIGIERHVPGKVQKAGAAVIPAKPFTQLLTTIRDDTITLEARAQQIILHTPTADVTIVSLNHNDFPTLPVIKREYTFSVPAQEFTGALERVLPAAATSDLKPELSGVLLSTAPATLTLAATDSFRLAEQTMTDHPGIREELACIVPLRTTQELFRSLAAEEGGDVRVSIGEHQAVFEWGGTRILSRLVDGTYPPYRAIIPAAYETTLLVSRIDLMEKIRMAAVFSSRLNDVTLRFSPTELEVATDNAETGSTRARLPVKGRGASGSAVFNYRYFSDGLAAAGGENILLSLNGVSGPTLISNPGDSSYRYLVMPIRSV